MVSYLLVISDALLVVSALVANALPNTSFGRTREITRMAYILGPAFVLAELIQLWPHK